MIPLTGAAMFTVTWVFPATVVGATGIDGEVENIVSTVIGATSETFPALSFTIT